MVGNGRNKKSMAYVGNVASFLEFAVAWHGSSETVNYINKPDFDMNSLVLLCRKTLGKKGQANLKIPVWAGLLAGYFFDLLAILLRKNLPVSSIRIKKFTADTVFGAPKIETLGFSAPYTLAEGLERTLNYEFKEEIKGHLFYSE
jgi:nucleoside-diphosphate-sugar epimerase